MSGFINMQTFIAFVLGVLLSTMVKATVSKLRGSVAGG